MELAPALYHNTSIEVLDLSHNYLDDMESARLRRDIIRRNKTVTTLNLSCNDFGRTLVAVECITDGMGSNSKLLKINLLIWQLGDGGVSSLAQNIGSRNMTLEKLDLDNNFITSTGVGVLVETMEQSSHHIADLDLANNPIGNEGAIILAGALGHNALPNLTCLCLFHCGIGDDGFIALVSALAQNSSLLQLDLLDLHQLPGSGFSERAYLAFAKSLPELKVLRSFDLTWCRGIASAVRIAEEHKLVSFPHCRLCTFFGHNNT